MLCSIVNSWRNGVRVTLYGGAGRQHGACSETFWASCIMLFVFPGKDGRVTGRTESFPESQMDYTLFLPPLAWLSDHPPTPSLLCYLRETANIIDVAFFPACGVRTKKLCFLSMLVLVLSFFGPLFLCLSAPLPVFYLPILMTYFSRMSDLRWNRALSITSKECQLFPL